MQTKPNQQFPLSFALSVLLHVLAIGFLMVNLSFISKPKLTTQTAPTVKVVDAVKLDQSKVEQEIARLQQAEKTKKDEEQARVRKLEKQAVEAKRKREQEKQHVAKLKQEQVALEKQRIEKQKQADKKLAEIKAKQAAEEKRVATIRAEAENAKKKKEAEQKRLAQLEKKRKQEEIQRLQNEAQKHMEQQLAQEQAQLRASQLQSQIDKYTALITQAVGRQWIVPDNAGKETSCVLLIRVAPGGSVIDVKLVSSSGDGVLDRSAQSAVYKASPLPVPEDPELFETFREIRLKVKPEGYLM